MRKMSLPLYQAAPIILARASSLVVDGKLKEPQVVTVSLLDIIAHSRIQKDGTEILAEARKLATLTLTYDDEHVIDCLAFIKRQASMPRKAADADFSAVYETLIDRTDHLAHADTEQFCSHKLHAAFMVLDTVDVPIDSLKHIRSNAVMAIDLHGLAETDWAIDHVERLDERIAQATDATDDGSTTSVLDSLDGEDDDDIDNVDIGPAIAAKANGAGVHDHADPVTDNQRVTG